MSTYYRPAGILSGMVAAAAIEAGLALPLAGGPLAFSLVEIAERHHGKVVRRVEPAVAGPALTAHAGSRLPLAGLAFEPPIVMGVVNVTPDSFSDGGAFQDPGRAVEHALTLVEAGAHILDIGGESTRPGAAPIAPEDEIARILPVLRGLRAAAAAHVVLSIDTRNAATMRTALDAGATMLNDVTAMTHDPEALAVAAGAGPDVQIVLMHMQGDPRTMQVAPTYDDVALDVFDYLEIRIAACEQVGISRRQLIVDPGIGFGKTVRHNLALLDQLTLFHGLGVPLMIGVSRKGFIGALSRREPVDRRLGGSLAGALWAIGQGAQIVRVHDVAETVQAVRLMAALRRPGSG